MPPVQLRPQPVHAKTQTARVPSLACLGLSRSNSSKLNCLHTKLLVLRPESRWHSPVKLPHSRESLLCRVADSSSSGSSLSSSSVTSPTAHPLVQQGPPADFDFRAATDSTSRGIITSRFPALLDLVEEGTLIAVPRPADYQERRTDGYREPELVLLVGTGHISPKSADDVRRVIEAVRPNNVVVELCRSRVSIMYDHDSESEPSNAGHSGSGAEAGLQGHVERDGGPGASTSGRDARKVTNPMALSGESLPKAFLRSLQLGSGPALAFRVLLGAIGERLSAKLGVKVGVDVRAARRAAEAVGAELVLGDRPIEITLDRAWTQLRWWRKARLVGTLLKGLVQVAREDSLDQEAVERLKSDDMVSAILEGLGDSFPEIMSPLIYERDLYLSWSLKRSKAVNGKQCVVGVIGRGHLRGVVYNLVHTRRHGTVRFRDLVGSRNVRKSKAEQRTAVVQLLAKEVAVGAALYGVWTAFAHLRGH